MKRIVAFLTVLSLIYGLATASQRAEKMPAKGWVEAELMQLSVLPVNEAFPILDDDIAAAAYSEGLMLWVDVSQRLLADNASQYHNESLHLRLLEDVDARRMLKSAEATRLDFLLDMARRNAVGTRALDIAYRTADCTIGTLYEIATPLTLLYFNDPNCDACEKVKNRLDTCHTLRNLVAENKLTVLAVYPFSDETLWQGTDYPDYIVNGREANGDIQNNDSYCWTSLPVFYLLDSNKMVIIKNEPSLNRVITSILDSTQKIVNNP